MSLTRDTLTPEKIKELLADPNSWLSKQIANEDLAVLDYLALVKRVIETEMNNAAKQMLAIQQAEEAANEQRSEHARKEFNEKYERYIHATVALDDLTQSLDPINMQHTLTDISQKLSEQAEHVWAVQQRAYANDLAHSLTQPIVLPNGEVYQMSQQKADEIADNVANRPSPMKVEENLEKYTSGNGYPHPRIEARDQLKQAYIEKHATDPKNPTPNVTAAAMQHAVEILNTAGFHTSLEQIYIMGQIAAARRAEMGEESYNENFGKSDNKYVGESHARHFLFIIKEQNAAMKNKTSDRINNVKSFIEADIVRKTISEQLKLANTPSNNNRRNNSI